ncbi:alpha/beta hydrolase [Candidatus Roseilinea sp. NK_OTU-006]|jgi:enterochelin esterase-like enzyme|uniref:alpha/beta hydrolase n=1 Tax=Candidatus Roseilinea sp. NK_OTU-006 TaxID=2704250 RepID=UPI00145E7628|nr:alpha/beta hydrolase-fold protein [Candidatus Roseilinea sp. NK_OTU-006]
MYARSNSPDPINAPARARGKVPLGPALLVIALIVGAAFLAIYALASREASASDPGIIQVIYVQPTPMQPLVGHASASLTSALEASVGTSSVIPQPRREWLESAARPLMPTRARPTAPPPPTATPDARSAPPRAEIALLSDGFAAPPCSQPAGQIITETLDSDITVVPITVHIYLPPCYDPERYAYPTLYLIHGTAFEQGGWLYNGVPRVADLQMSLGVLPPFIIVMPGADMRAGEASRYSWTNTGPGSYDDFVVNELLPYIDQHYSTWADRDGRAIGGISRGGYWSIEIAFAHPDLFSAVGGHSPSVFTRLVGVPPNFSMLSMARSIDALRDLRIWLDSGNADWAKVDMRKLMDDLDAAGVPYHAEIGEGGHEDSYWTSRVPDYLAFYAASWPRVPRAKMLDRAAAP